MKGRVLLHLFELCMVLVSTVLHLLSKIFLLLSEVCLFVATFLEKTGADCALRLEVVLILAVFFVLIVDIVVVDIIVVIAKDGNTLLIWIVMSMLS